MIDQAIVRFLGHLKYDQGSAQNTILAYQTDLTQFRKVINQRAEGPFQPAELDSDLMAVYTEWVEEQDYRPATVARKLAALRSFLHYLEERGHLKVEGLLERLQAPAPPPRRPRALTRDEIQRLLTAPSNSTSARDMRDAAILSLLYATGVRAEEAVRIEVHDVDLTRGLLDRDGAATDPLPLKSAYHKVERYLKEGRPQLVRKRGVTTLFLNQRGEGLSRQGLWLVVKRWARACNLGEDVSPYTLRHSLTRHMLQSGHTKKEVQKVLGLSSANTLRRHMPAGAAAS